MLMLISVSVTYIYIRARMGERKGDMAPWFLVPLSPRKQKSRKVGHEFFFCIFKYIFLKVLGGKRQKLERIFKYHCNS